MSLLRWRRPPCGQGMLRGQRLEDGWESEGNAWGDLGGKRFGWGERSGVLSLHPPPLPRPSTHLPGDEGVQLERGEAGQAEAETEPGLVQK